MSSFTELLEEQSEREFNRDTTIVATYLARPTGAEDLADIEREFEATIISILKMCTYGLEFDEPGAKCEIWDLLEGYILDPIGPRLEMLQDDLSLGLDSATLAAVLRYLIPTMNGREGGWLEEIRAQIKANELEEAESNRMGDTQAGNEDSWREANK